MKKYLLGVLLTSCTTKHEILQEKIPTFTYEQVEKYMELQERCDFLLESAGSKYILFSTEFYEERKELLKELEIYFPWAEYPKSLERCVNDLEAK